MGSSTRAKGAVFFVFFFFAKIQSCSCVFELLLKLHTKESAFDVDQSTCFSFKWKEKPSNHILDVC